MQGNQTQPTEREDSSPPDVSEWTYCYSPYLYCPTAQDRWRIGIPWGEVSGIGAPTSDIQFNHSDVAVGESIPGVARTLTAAPRQHLETATVRGCVGSDRCSEMAWRQDWRMFESARAGMTRCSVRRGQLASRREDCTRRIRAMAASNHGLPLTAEGGIELRTFPAAPGMPCGL